MLILLRGGRYKRRPKTFWKYSLLSSAFENQPNSLRRFDVQTRRTMYGIATALLCLVALSQASTQLAASPKAVEGIISCGSEAEVVDIRITDCQAVPCEAIIGNRYRIDVDFKPNLSHPQLHLNIVLIHGGQNVVIIDGPVGDSAVEAGQSYTFGYEYSITGAFLGPAQIAFNLLGKNGAADYPELCFYVGIVVS